MKEKALELILEFGLDKIAAESNIPEVNLRRWVKNGAALTNNRRGWKVKHPNLEEEILKFIDKKEKLIKPRQVEW